MAAIEAGCEGDSAARFGAVAGVTPGQKLTLLLLLAILLLGWWCDTRLILDTMHGLVVMGFVVSACSKLVLAGLGREPTAPPPLRRDLLPTYTVLVPLYREAAVVEQLVAALSALDYPRSRLQAILILEADDDDTLGALAWLRLPPFIERE